MAGRERLDVVVDPAGEIGLEPRREFCRHLRRCTRRAFVLGHHARAGRTDEDEACDPVAPEPGEVADRLAARAGMTHQRRVAKVEGLKHRREILGEALVVGPPRIGRAAVAASIVGHRPQTAGVHQRHDLAPDPRIHRPSGEQENGRTHPPVAGEQAVTTRDLDEGRASADERRDGGGRVFVSVAFGRLHGLGSSIGTAEDARRGGESDDLGGHGQRRGLA